MTLPLAVEQVDLHAFEHVVRIVEVAVGAVVGVDAAADRAGQQLAEVVFDARVAPVDRDLADAVARRRNVGHAAQVARRVLAVEPGDRVNFDDRVRAGRQVGEFVVAGGVGRRPQAGVVAVAVEQLQHDVADAFFAGAIEVAVIVAVVVDVARERHADLLAEVVLNRVDARTRALMPVKMLNVRPTSCVTPPTDADALAAVVVLGRLMLADLVDAGREAGEVVLAVGVGEREAMKLPLASSKSIRTPSSRISGSSKLQSSCVVGVHAAADRAGQQFAEVVFHGVVAVSSSIAPKMRSTRPAASLAAVPPWSPAVSLPSSQPVGCTSRTPYVPGNRLRNS